MPIKAPNPEDIYIHPVVRARFKELRLCDDPYEWPFEDRYEWTFFLEKRYVMVKFDKIGHEQMGKDWYMMMAPECPAGQLFWDWIFEDQAYEDGSISLTPPPGWVEPEQEAGEGEEWKNE